MNSFGLSDLVLVGISSAPQKLFETASYYISLMYSSENLRTMQSIQDNFDLKCCAYRTGEYSR